jgi:hypothetical protein
VIVESLACWGQSPQSRWTFGPSETYDSEDAKFPRVIELRGNAASVLLASGARLFDHLAGTPAVLGNPTVIRGVGVTHLRYPVHKA